jgi:hypothetical protein
LAIGLFQPRQDTASGSLTAGMVPSSPKRGTLRITNDDLARAVKPLCGFVGVMAKGCVSGESLPLQRPDGVGRVAGCVGSAPPTRRVSVVIRRCSFRYLSRFLQSFETGGAEFF